MNVKTYSKKSDSNLKISTNFKVKEFACNDGSDKILIDVDLVNNTLQLLRSLCNSPLYINSGYRTESYNKKVDGATNSYHVKGRAFDISNKIYTTATLAKCCELLGCNGIGIYNTQKFIHIDSREKKYYWKNNGKEVAIKSFINETEISAVQAILFYKYKGVNCSKVDGIIGNKTITMFIHFCKHATTTEKSCLMNTLENGI